MPPLDETRTLVPGPGKCCMYTSLCPVSSESKASHRPSGERRPPIALYAVITTGCGAPPPETGSSQIARFPLGGVSVKRRDFPSRVQSDGHWSPGRDSRRAGGAEASVGIR